MFHIIQQLLFKLRVSCLLVECFFWGTCGDRIKGWCK
ncbi:hypothetical protein Goari_025544 [Gossypium aridum]|nr:hypothetical protein [Gossypium aridum]